MRIPFKHSRECAHEALGDGVCPRSPYRRSNDPNAFGSGILVEADCALGLAVAKEGITSSGLAHPQATPTGDCVSRTAEWTGSRGAARSFTQSDAVFTERTSSGLRIS
jgi:hypothetical protein